MPSYNYLNLMDYFQKWRAIGIGNSYCSDSSDEHSFQLQAKRAS